MHMNTCLVPSVRKLLPTMTYFIRLTLTMMAKVKNILLIFVRLTYVWYMHMCANNCLDMLSHFKYIPSQTFPMF